MKGSQGVKASSCPVGVISPKCVCLPVNHRVEAVLPPLRAEDAPCRFLCDTSYDSLSGALGIWLASGMEWNVLDVDGRSVWNPPLPSTRVGVSGLQPVSPRKYRAVCV